MLYFKALHTISFVAWFAGLFYLPRLFVYHAQASDAISHERFCIMERRLYYGIMTPAGIATLIFGFGLMSYNWSYYLSQGWLHAKLSLIGLLWAYHLSCGHYRQKFAQQQNQRSSRFFRIYNEIPTVCLISIVLLAVLRPF